MNYHHSFIFSMSRVHGYKRENTSTYAMISGMINFGWAVGAMVGPVGCGALTQALGFPWALTISVFINLLLVSSISI